MKSLLLAIVVFVGSLWMLLVWTTSAPGTLPAGALPAVTPEELASSLRIQETCETLAQEIGPRGPASPALATAEEFLQRELRRARLDVSEIQLDAGGTTCHAYEVVLAGRGLARESIVLGAHYDTNPNSPGADDNASGCAVLLEIARMMSGSNCDRTVRFVFWGQGSKPFAGTEKSGAWAYAKRVRARKETVAAVIVLDSVGVYKDKPGSQSVPFPFNFFYPDRGDFIGFVSDYGSRSTLEKAIAEFRHFSKLPSQAVSMPGWCSGISDSDDGSFRALDMPAVRVTDTGSLRSPQIGGVNDKPGTLDYERMARLASGLAATVQSMGKKTSSLL